MHIKWHSVLRKHYSCLTATALPGALPCGIAESGKNRHGECAVANFPFRVPLNAEAKALRFGAAYGLDLTIGRRRLDAQSRRRFVDPLGVQGVDRDLALGPQRSENSAAGQIEAMHRSVLHIARLVLVLAVIEAPGYFVHRLMQGAAERHVDDL